MKDLEFQRRLFFYNSLLPLVLLAWDWNQNQLGANPVEAVIRTTGVLTLIFVVITLCVTPFSKWFHVLWLVKHRRLFGLYSFFYASLHLLIYLFLDQDGNLAGVPADIVKRPFIAVGMFCYLMLVPLAATSTNKMIQRLGGKRWKRLHKLTYVIAVGGVIHYWMIVKSDITYPLIFAIAVGFLLVVRIQASLKKKLS